MIVRRHVCIAVGSPDLERAPARFTRSIASLAAVLKRNSCDVTLLAHGLDNWRDLDVDPVDLSLFPTERDFGSTPQSTSYRLYEWLKLHPFDAVVFPDFCGPGFIPLHAKRAGLRFAKTTLAVLRCGALLDELERRGTFPSSADDIVLAHMERSTRAWADLVLSPSRVWLDRTQGQLGARQAVIPLLAEAREVPHEPAPTREIVFWGNGNGHSLATVCQALKTLTPRARQAKFTFLSTDPTSAITEREIERRASDEVNYDVMAAGDREAALVYLLANRATAIVLPPPGFSFESADCLARGIPFVSVEDPCLQEWVAADSSNVLPGPLTRDAIAALIERLVREPSSVGRPRYTTDELRQQEDAAIAALLAPSARPSPRTPPKISVCMTHHNRPTLLRYAVESLLAQTVRDFEVILVDDGSYDPDALAYLDTLEPRFAARGWKIIRQSNAYLGAARNRAVREAKHEYVLFMDDDNIAMPHEIETFGRVAAASGADLVMCRAAVFWGAGEPTSLRSEGHIPVAGAALAPITNSFGDANAMVRKTAFEAIGGFTTDYGLGYEDWELFSRLALHGCEIVLIPEELYYYRILDGSMLNMGAHAADTYRAMRPYFEAYPALREMLLLAQGYHLKALRHEGSLEARISTPIHTLKRRAKQHAAKLWARFGLAARTWRE